MRRRQLEQTQEEERERSTKESGARVKIFNATSPPPSLAFLRIIIPLVAIKSSAARN